MKDYDALRRRALEFDAAWEKAFNAGRDTTSVFEAAEAEGFRPVKVTPPGMFAHCDELRRLASFWGRGDPCADVDE